MKKIAVLIILLLLIMSLTGCTEYDYGLVINKEGEPVPGVQITIDGEINLTSNEEGYFALKNLEGEHTVELSKKGYYDEVKEIDFGERSHKVVDIILTKK